MEQANAAGIEITLQTFEDFNIVMENFEAGTCNAVTTDVDGNWSVPGGTGSASVSATLQGPYVRVFNQNGAEAQYSGTATETT